jgi:hypothetical protein
MFRKILLGEHGGCRPVTSTLGRLRQENHEFKASTSYIVRICFKKQRARDVV